MKIPDVVQRQTIRLVILSTLFLSPAVATGAGFAIIEQSVSGLGNAFAGGAATAVDATTIFFNPAGLTRLGGIQFVAGGHLIIPSAKFSNKGSTHLLQDITMVPLLGGHGGEGGVVVPVPNMYGSASLTDRLVVGVGINSPFGLKTNYDPDWVGRYHAINSELLTINLNPSAAYKINERLSLGVGINVVYANVKLSSAIDFGTLDAIGAFSDFGLAPGSLGLTPQLSDGQTSLEGDSWGFGYNAGLLMEFNENTRVGMAYRSRINHNIEGDAGFSDVPSGLAPYPIFKNTGARADLTVPDNLSISLYCKIKPQWDLLADFTWTNWSVFEKLEVNFDNPYQPTTLTTEDWRDSYRYALGLTYSPGDLWVFRAGTAYDTSVISSNARRTPRIPDEERFWVTLGTGYSISESIHFDVGYAHLFVTDAKIEKTAVDEDAVRGGLTGVYTSHVDIVSAQVSIVF